VSLFGIGLMPAEEDYHSSLGRMTTLIGEAAQALAEMFADNVEEGERYATHIKSIERACDEITHDVSTRLRRSFITAIDREDIHALVTALDDVVDLIEALASAMIMYRIQDYTPHMRLFAGVIQQMAPKLDAIVRTIDRPRDIKTLLPEIHELEREGDEIYQEAIADLFRGSLSPQTIIVLKDIYENLEATVDRCQNISDLVERIVIKNT
jgi:predicted phosphate transport protein (TIGR00153 family)